MRIMATSYAMDVHPWYENDVIYHHMRTIQQTDTATALTKQCVI